MSDRKIANRYAEALMQQAIAGNTVNDVADSIKVVNETCLASKDLRNVLKNPIINPSQKQNALLAVFKETHPLVYDFIKLVCGKNRESLLLLISEAFLDLYRKNNGIELVNVESAAALTENDKKSIQQFVQKKTGAKSVELLTEINPSIIGGLLIKFGDNLLDTSISAKLRKLKKELNIA